MIQGRVKKEDLTVDDIMNATNGGYDIFMGYLGKVSRLMNRPWGKREKKMSWGLYPKGNVWFWKDQATEETGNAIHFVERYFGLSFVEALDRISWDFNLRGNTNNSPIKILWDKPEITEKEYMHISFTDIPFTRKHHEFWNIADVTEDHLRKLGGYAVKDLAINRKRVGINKGEIVFAFYAKEEDGVKIYFPERERDKRFRNNVSFHYLWNYSNLQKCDNLIVQKSFKDMAVTTMITPCCCATQAEAVKIFDKETVESINNISKTPWIWYGSDWDGVKKCKSITDTNGWKYINTPKNLLPDVNDTYSFVKMHNLKIPGSGLIELEKFMKSKKLIWKKNG